MVELHDDATLLKSAAHDEGAFRALVEPHSNDLLLLCYRMLGGFIDAEDARQETLLKAWRNIERFNGRSSVRTWLCRIATNTCIDLLRAQKRRVLPYDVKAGITSSWTEPSEWGDPAMDLPWLEPYPDAYMPESEAERREGISLAFIRALQLLPARQRAVLVLRDVLDWSAQEVATTLETSVPAVNSALQRARATVSAASSSRSDAKLNAGNAQLAARFIEVWEEGDIEGLLALLSDDAVVMMPPMLAWFQGIETLRSAFAHSWEMNPRPGVFRVKLFPLNGQIGLAYWYRPHGNGNYVALALDVLTLDDAGKVREMVSFVKPQLFDAVGLPRELPPEERVLG